MKDAMHAGIIDTRNMAMASEGTQDLSAGTTPEPMYRKPPYLSS